MAELKHTFKTDILFKMLFTKHKNLLRHLVAHLLRIPLNDITEFRLENPEMPPESMGKKFTHLDIHMAVNYQQVNLEVQVENEQNYPERSLYHWARMYSNALPVGEDYAELPRTIVISILDFPLFKQYAQYHSEFQAMEVTRNNPLTDKMVLHFFELPKLPECTGSDDILLLWLTLFNANTEEELTRIKDMEVSELSEAVNAYHNVTKSAEFREIERLRIKASHDEAQALKNAEQRGEKRANAKWQGVIADKDAELEDMGSIIADKDAKLVELSKKVAELQAEGGIK